VLDKAEYSAFESTLKSSIVSFRIVRLVGCGLKWTPAFYAVGSSFFSARQLRHYCCTPFVEVRVWDIRLCRLPNYNHVIGQFHFMNTGIKRAVHCVYSYCDTHW